MGRYVSSEQIVLAMRIAIFVGSSQKTCSNVVGEQLSIDFFMETFLHNYELSETIRYGAFQVG